MFSATMPPEALEIALKFMNVRILVKRDDSTLRVSSSSMSKWRRKIGSSTLCDLYETLAIVDSSSTRRLDDDSSNIRRLDDYRAELHNLLKEDVCYYQTDGLDILL